MSYITQVAKYIGKREAYRFYRKSTKNVKPISMDAIGDFFITILFIVVSFSIFSDRINSYSWVLILAFAITARVASQILFKKAPIGTPNYGPVYKSVRDRRFANGIRQDYVCDKIISYTPFEPIVYEKVKKSFRVTKIIYAGVIIILFIGISLIPKSTIISNKNGDDFVNGSGIYSKNVKELQIYKLDEKGELVKAGVINKINPKSKSPLGLYIGRDSSLNFYVGEEKENPPFWINIDIKSTKYLHRFIDSVKISKKVKYFVSSNDVTTKPNIENKSDAR